MSSLAATQSDSYYVPPEYFTSGAYKHKTPNQYQNSKGHNQFLQNGVVRFELPYDGFCLECKAHVGKGTRFNAKKKFNGEMYFTSKIWEFEMKCRVCAKSKFLIKTNPKGRCFDYVKGIKKKVEEFDTIEAQSLGVIEIGDDNCTKGIVPFTMNDKEKEMINDNVCNPIDKLENVASGKRKALSERDQMEALINIQSHVMLNDADSNSIIRSKYRTKRIDRKKRMEETNSYGLGKGILLGEKKVLNKSDICSLINRKECVQRRKQIKMKDDERNRWLKLRSKSIFAHDSSIKAHTISRKQRSKNKNNSSTSTKKQLMNKVSSSHVSSQGIYRHCADNMKKKKGNDVKSMILEEKKGLTSQLQQLTSLDDVMNYSSDGD